ncbi:oxidoreductase [Vibrio barjaei]|uniref:oxidoreductase n=1 Tax=Vibrio barjaei TaxID=1676683 RepID=UPI002283B6AB|nr:oxidoreductase [Vibrio barjaei]MCY9872536.1 oxidoreductase [Vibrio barjaei]
MTLQNKTILVAGAGGLLGSSLVKALLEHDAKVIAFDIDMNSMKQRLQVLGVKIDQPTLELDVLDITDSKAVKSYFEKLDSIDGAVNSTYPRNKTYGQHFLDVTFDSFNDNLALHMGSAFLFLQQCALQFNKQQAPLSLVNLSSIYGVVAPKFDVYDGTSMTMPVEYAAIKAGIQHLTKYAVNYIKDSRFRVNCVCPGGILDGQPVEFLQAYKKKTHGTGMLDVSEVIGTILFLLSEQSKYITGQNLVVDDGFSL